MAVDKEEKPAKEYDIFKDSLLRYLGYANEVGESFRVLVPRSVVRFSYVVASAYVAADSVDKGYLMWKGEAYQDIQHTYWQNIDGKKPSIDENSKYKEVGIATVDTLIWQGLASVAVPGFTINRICWATRRILLSIKALPAPIQTWGVVAAGLGSIPFIVKPIDNSTDWFMDATIRKLYGYS